MRRGLSPCLKAYCSRRGSQHSPLPEGGMPMAVFLNMSMRFLLSPRPLSITKCWNSQRWRLSERCWRSDFKVFILSARVLYCAEIASTSALQRALSRRSSALRCWLSFIIWASSAGVRVACCRRLSRRSLASAIFVLNSSICSWLWRWMVARDWRREASSWLLSRSAICLLMAEMLASSCLKYPCGER